MFSLIAGVVSVFTKVVTWVTTIGKAVGAVDTAIRSLSKSYRMKRALQSPQARAAITSKVSTSRYYGSRYNGYTVPSYRIGDDDDDDLDDEDFDYITGKTPPVQ